MQAPGAAELAIQSFERIHQLRVTVHDLRGNLAPQLLDARARHGHALCRCVKAGAGGESKCVAFEMLALRRQLHTFPEGRYHVCHAGLVEWVLPVHRDLELLWILFAGVRRPGAGMKLAVREPLTRWEKGPPWRGATLALPPVVEDAEAADTLEHLRQLGARLVGLLPRSVKVAPEGSRLLEREKSIFGRRTLIMRFITSNQHRDDLRLAHLARELGVTEDRATHVVRQCCGHSFRTLLVESRLRTAQELLGLSSLPITEIAFSSGFGEISHFNRLFRARTGMTPSAWRRRAEQNGLPPRAPHSTKN